MTRPHRIAPTFLAVVLAAACGDGGAAGDTAELIPVDSLVTTASGQIGGVYDLYVTPDGHVVVADYGFKHVLVVAPDGSTRTVGEEGQGPGEFSMPQAAGGTMDSLRVFDAMSHLVQVFGADGHVVRSYRLDVPGIGGGRTFAEDGRLAATVDGFEDAMVMVYDPAGERMATLGEPVAPAVPFMDFVALKAEIRDGKVPDAFRNRGIVAWGPKGSLFVVFLAEPEVRKYAADGSLVWSQRLDEPAMTAAFDRWVERNTQDPNPSRIYSLQYAYDANAVAGDLWVVLNSEELEDGRILVLDGDGGTIRQRITLPGLPNTGPFDVDEERGLLYMAPRQEASVLVFELPGR